MAPHEDANAVLDWYDLPDPDGLDHFLHVDVGTAIGAGFRRTAGVSVCHSRNLLVP
jgi:hypothetical protein